MSWLFTASPTVLAATFFLVGAIVGGLANLWSIVLTGAADGGDRLAKESNESSRWPQLLPLVGSFLSLGRGRFRGRSLGWRSLAVEAATGCLFAAYVVAAAHFGCQQIDEVRPDEFWRYARIVYHLVLMGLLVAATAADLRACVIPDQITFPGTFLGLAGAAVSGQLQMVHVWVDWNQEIPGIAGPYLPAWLDAHRHLHGLAWSAAGGLLGAGMTWIVRFVSQRMLGRESLGLGDVTLMAMIGTFLGWQPTVFVFALAPLVGLVCVAPALLSGRRDSLPYGPFLSSAAVIVLFSWRRIWMGTRLVFGHPPSLALLCLAAAGAMLALLAGLRVFRRRFDKFGSRGDGSRVR